MVKKIAQLENPYESACAFTQAVLTVGAKAGNIINVAVTLKDEMVKTLPTLANGGGPVRLRAYLSDDVHGDNLTGTTPSGGVAIGTNGVILNQAVSGKTFDILVPSTTPGLFDLSITHASPHNFYLCVEVPGGKIFVSPIIAF